jgi:hypothetical protein
MILSGRGLVNHAPQDFFYSDYFRNTGGILSFR